MILFDHPIWLHLKPYARLDAGRDNLDLHQLPEKLRELALGVFTNCIACGESIHPLRAREKSQRSRVGGTQVEKRLFYAPTCPTEKNPGCSRTRVARAHKETIRALVLERKEPVDLNVSGWRMEGLEGAVEIAVNTARKLGLTRAQVNSIVDRYWETAT